MTINSRLRYFNLSQVFKKDNIFSVGCQLRTPILSISASRYAQVHKEKESSNVGVGNIGSILGSGDKGNPMQGKISAGRNYATKHKNTKAKIEAYLAKEPREPKMKTAEFPGPQTKKLLGKMSKTLDTRHMITVMDLDKSYGNFLVDADGNELLNLNVKTSAVMCGYNNPILMELHEQRMEDTNKEIINRPNLYGYYPISDSYEYLQHLLKRQMPKGFSHLVLCKDPLDTAIRMAIQRQKRKLHQPTRDDISTYSNSMLDIQSDIELPLVATFQYKDSKESPLIRRGIPQPTIQFPKLRYPLRNNLEHNSKEEAHSLELLDITLKNDKRIAAVIIQPILIDRHASPSFYKGLREITSRHDILLIVDERYTAGGMTGTFYAHEQWELPSPPDIVTFNNQLQGAGCFHHGILRPPSGYKLAQIDPLSIWHYEVLVNIMEDNDLMTKVKIAGEKVRDGLYELEKRFPDLIHNARGVGAICAVNCATDVVFNRILQQMKLRGVILGKTAKSARTLLIRPMMIFGDRHADIFLNAFEESLEKELANYGD